jgi:hypothetical protein
MCDKRLYETRQDAINNTHFDRKKGNHKHRRITGNLHVYYCTSCEGYHTTTQKPNSFKLNSFNNKKR